MFRERLTAIAGRIEGARALSLIAKDGIAVDAISEAPDIDLDVLAAELISQVKVISDDHRDLNVGEVQHYSVTTDRMTIMLSAVTDEYYLLLVLAEPASQGRARFELRRARLVLEQDLVV